MKEVTEACYVECVAQKARKAAEAKARKEAKKQRITEEEEKKKQIEYIQQLQDKVLVKNSILLEDTEGFQIIRSKHKKTTSEDEERRQFSKKAKEKQPGKYHKDAGIKMVMSTPMRNVYMSDRIVWCTIQGE